MTKFLIENTQYTPTVQESVLGVLSDHRAVAGVSPEAGEQDRLPGQRDPPGRPGHHRGGGPGLRGRVWRPLEVLLRPGSPQGQQVDQSG